MNLKELINTIVDAIFKILDSIRQFKKSSGKCSDKDSIEVNIKAKIVESHEHKGENKDTPRIESERARQGEGTEPEGAGGHI